MTLNQVILWLIQRQKKYELLISGSAKLSIPFFKNLKLVDIGYTKKYTKLDPSKYLW